MSRRSLGSRDARVRVACISVILAMFFVASQIVFSDRVFAQTVDRDTPSCTLGLELENEVTPATVDYFQKGFARAEELRCNSVFVRINTPGGNLQSTREIVELILNSPRPVLCLVGPSGGHAGSAGAIILFACHVAAAELATNVGAATPIASGGTLDEDARNKVIQDTMSWVQGLARLRDRNVDLAGRVVTEALALDADQAAREKLIDFVALDPADFFHKAQGRPVKTAGGVVVPAGVGAVTPYEAGVRNQVLQIITDPEIAYLIFMASLALIYFELTHPGAVAPGVAGGIGLLLSLIAFHKLNVWWGGVSLIGLGAVLLIAEAFVPSFGALGVGGIAAFAAGSLLLYDPGVIGFSLPLALVVGTSLLIGGTMLAVALLVIRKRKRGRADLEAALLAKVGEVASLESPSLRRGMVIVNGEYWHFTSDRDVRVGDKVQVVSQEKLNLNVKPYQSR